MTIKVKYIKSNKKINIRRAGAFERMIDAMLKTHRQIIWLGPDMRGYACPNCGVRTFGPHRCMIGGSL